jgi:hypothetical protein
VLAYLFGVRPPLVSKWRRALGIPQTSPGASERRVAPKRGVPRPRHVLAALRVGRRPITPAARVKLSAANRRAGNRPAKDRNRLWTAKEDALVTSLPPPEAARLTSRTSAAVYKRWRELVFPDGRAGRSVRPANGWTAREDAALRGLAPCQAAKKLGRTLEAIYLRGRHLGLNDGRRDPLPRPRPAKPPQKGTNGRFWSTKELSLLGKQSDAAIAKRFRRSVGAVRQRRTVLGIPTCLGRRCQG